MYKNEGFTSIKNKILQTDKFDIKIKCCFLKTKFGRYFILIPLNTLQTDTSKANVK